MNAGNAHTPSSPSERFYWLKISISAKIWVLAPGWQKNSSKNREAFCFLQNPSPFLPCASLPDKFNLPRKINKFLWCEFKASKYHGELILSVGKASLIKTSLIFALPKQPLRWGSKEKGKNQGTALCQCRCSCPSWGSAGPKGACILLGSCVAARKLQWFLESLQT